MNQDQDIANLTKEEMDFYDAWMTKLHDDTIGHILMQRERALLRLIDMCNTPCWRYKVS